MTTHNKKNAVLYASLGIFVVPVVLLTGCFLVDLYPMLAARPPGSLKTVDEFEAWKRGAVRGKGTLENAGLTYTVMLAPAGGLLASGPSAYLFDEKGQFVDWTPDMGDSLTVKRRFDLSGGRVRNIRREKP